MAAMYSGIHLKLKSPRTPWTDKLKLARFAWISPQCFLPNKEQVLFDWTSHALTGCYNKKVELPQEVTTHLLQPLLLLRHLLTTQVWAAEDDARARQHLAKEIRGKVDAVLQSALYLPDHLHSYREELLPNKEPPASVRGPMRKGLLTPVNTILQRLRDPGLCDPSLHFAVCSSSIPLLFKFALDAFCRAGDNKAVCFQLLTRFVTALDFTEELTTKDNFDPANWSLALLALESLLNLALSGDVYNVAADRIQHGEAQFNFFRKVAQLLLHNTQSGVPAWYRCLKALLALNHLVLDPDLDELVSATWVDADCVEVRVKKAREALVTAVIQTYTKLRQLPRLFQEVLAAVCSPAADELRRPILTAALQRSLSQCLLDSPPSQSLEIWRLILERAQSHLLPDLEEKEDMALKLLLLSGLLHAVLFSVRSLDGGSPLPVLRQTQELMGETLALIRLLLRLLAGRAAEAPWFQSAHQALLLLSYTWVEVDTLFEMHCDRYRSNPAEMGASLLPGVGADEWDQVLSVTQSPLSQLLQQLLTLQRMKKVLLRTDVSTDAGIRDDLCKDAQFIVSAGKASFHEVSEAVWDRQVSSVDSSTYQVAHWFLVTSNLGLIAPFLYEEDMSHVAGVLLDTLLCDSVPDRPEKEVTHLSVTQISKQLLDSAMLVELSPLYSVIVRRLSQRIVGVLCNSEQGSQCQALLKFGEEVRVAAGEEKEAAGTETRGNRTEASPTWNRLESIAQRILGYPKADAKVTLMESQTVSLVRLLQVTRALNPDAMGPADHSECFLLLFYMATNIQPQPDAEPSNVLELLTKVYNRMASLQSGRNAGSVLKVVHGSELLKAAMSSVFSLSKCITQTVESPTLLAFVQAIQGFLQCLLQVIIHRRKSVWLNLEKFTSFVVDSEVAANALSSLQGEAGPEVGSLVSLKLLLACLSTLCKTMTANLGKSSKLDETLLQLSQRVVGTLGPAVQLCLRGQACELLGQAFSVDVVTVMVQAELSLVSSCTSEGGEQGDEQGGLAHMGLYRSFAQQVLKELCSAPRPMDFLFSSLRFLTAYYIAAERTREPNLVDIYVSVLQNLRTLLSAPWLSVSEVQELEAPLKELLAQLVSQSTLEQLHLLLGALREGLGSMLVMNGRCKDVLSTVTLTKLLMTCPLPEACHKSFWFLVPQIISAIVFVVQDCGKDPVLASGLAVPALEALTTVLRQGEGVLSNPHHVGLMFGALQLIPLELPSATDYLSVFHAVHEVLFAIVQCHPQVLLKASASFLNCFYRLVVSVMQEGRQRAEAERGSEAETEVALKCALLVERMYTHIASVSEGFTVLSSFIVAQYVSELQRVTLHPEIKSHLTEGIYKILDLCTEQDVKFLSSTLPLGVREVFNELYSSYTHYHKSQRQGEAKYTA
ncbi:hypothetical protein AAFF_G00063260 [Aldrovandia affinis]|uniref:Nucleolar 27S pre-rRNA processing Urb2/Npa2 C-terminal domain-containing protein n=1 Tax=Aldrovandia affinis TaxID=143900 RepID=A0AAD7WEQ5_9TELE|nr:hypothetical protein AAFF_G00063260 [Aldrovandia affinis]